MSVSQKVSEVIMTIDHICQRAGVQIESDIVTQTFAFSKDGMTVRRTYDDTFSAFSAGKGASFVLAIVNEIISKTPMPTNQPMGQVVYAILLEQNGWLADCKECKAFMSQVKTEKKQVNVQTPDGQTRQRVLMIAGTVTGIRAASELMTQVDKMPNVRVVRVLIKQEQGDGWNQLEFDQWPKPQGFTFGVSNAPWQTTSVGALTFEKLEETRRKLRL